MRGEPGVAELIGQLREDISGVARAEIAYRKAQAAAKAGTVKHVAIFGGAAAVLALAAVVTLLVGLVLSLATLVGPLGATGIVVGVTLILAYILARVAMAPVSGGSA